MKTFLLVLLGAMIALVCVNRQRIYVCDPLAKVYKYAPLQGRLAAPPEHSPASLIKGLAHSSHSGASNVDVENNADAVVANKRYGVITEHGKNGSSDSAANGAASGVANLQRSVSDAQQSSRSVLNLGDNASQTITDLVVNDPSKGRQSGVQVFVNLSGDVMLERDDEPGSYRILLQDWNKSAGTPKYLTCLHWVACLTDADRATVDLLDWIGNSGRGKGKYDPHLATTEHGVSFINGKGEAFRVELR